MTLQKSQLQNPFDNTVLYQEASENSSQRVTILCLCRNLRLSRPRQKEVLTALYCQAHRKSFPGSACMTMKPLLFKDRHFCAHHRCPPQWPSTRGKQLTQVTLPQCKGAGSRVRILGEMPLPLEIPALLRQQKGTCQAGVLKA